MFREDALGPSARAEQVEKAYGVRQDYRAAFDSSRGLVENYLYNIYLPASKRWAVKINHKAASTSLLRALFQIEYGVPLSASFEDSSDLNSDPAPRLLTNDDFFRRVHFTEGGIGALEHVERIVTVRHPALRVLSAFNYLCIAQKRRHRWKAETRIEMTALVGFDWDAHAGTVEGFERFLDYIEAVQALRPERRLDSHWRSQYETIRPDIFQPTLVGHTEIMKPFFDALEDRFGVRGLGRIHSNAAARNRDESRPFLAPRAVRNRIEALYARDFEAFGYTYHTRWPAQP